MATPYALLSLEETASTQDDARLRFDGTAILVVAERQTRGRGRRGSRWETAPRALAASLAFAPDWPVETWPLLPLVAGLSALESLPASFDLKWPNDVVGGDAKVAGILVEASEDVVVAGIGVNLWWADPPSGFAAVYEADPGVSEHRSVAERWATNLMGRLARGPEAWGRDEYAERCVTLGRSIRWQPDGEGVALDVDHDGSLLVRTVRGIERLNSGQVWEVRHGTRGFGGTG